MKINGRRWSIAGIATLSALTAWTIVCLLPVYWLAITSLKSEAALNGPPTYFPFVDFVPTLSSWSFILFDRYESLWVSYINSFVVAVISTALTMGVASLAAYAITRLWTGQLQKWGRFLFAAALLTRLLPPFVLVLPIYLMGQVSGLLDSRTLLIIIYAAINMPVALWLLRPVYGSKAFEQEEAALLDGASHLQTFSGS